MPEMSNLDQTLLERACQIRQLYWCRQPHQHHL